MKIGIPKEIKNNENRVAKKKTILIVGTADTKDDELQFMKKCIQDQGGHPAVMDVGVLGDPTFVVEYTKHEVAAAANTTNQAIIDLGDENKAMTKTAKGAAKLAKQLCQEGKIDGVLMLGGTMGTDLSLDVANALPFGFPKFIVTTIAFSHLIPPERLSPDLMILWNINCGYGRTEIKEAIVNQLDELVYYSTFRGTSHPRSIELSHRLMEMTKPENMKRVFYSSGGSDAMETAMKLARQYWKVLGQKDRYKFISLKDGYHGTHFGSASVTGGDRFRKGCEPALPGCYHIESPWMYRNMFTEDDPVLLGQKCAEMLDRTITHLGPKTVAAFIAEPVLGAGGVIVPPENFFPLCREICDKHGVLFIADEVITGFGRTGAMFGSRGWGVAPDIMTSAKGITSGYIPLGATLFNERIDDAFANNNNGDGYIAHGYTYSGHPVGCAAALAALDILERENLPENAGKQGAYMLDRLKPFVEKFKSVGNVRGKGLMIALELVSDKKTKAPCSKPYITDIYEETLKRGAIVRTSGNKIIISPPLVIQQAEVDVIVDALEGAFGSVKY